MARSPKATSDVANNVSEPTPKKRIGRPPGSKNRVAAAPVASVKRATPKKAAAPAASKLNKAELEYQVIKLERTIARLRKQNAEFKQTARDDTPKAAF